MSIYDKLKSLNITLPRLDSPVAAFVPFVRTGNLVYALFPHDTSRAGDPQSHIHAVIANMTRLPEQYVQEQAGGFVAIDFAERVAGGQVQ